MSVEWHFRLCSFLLLLLLASFYSCVSAREFVQEALLDNGSVRDMTPNSSTLSQRVFAPQIVPSTRPHPAPRILGVNFVETIGCAGQGAGQFIQPLGLALDRLERLYITDSGNNRVQVVDLEGNFISEFGNRGWRTGEFDHPTATAIDFQRSEILYVLDTGNSRVQYCNLVDRIFHLMVGSAPDYDSNSSTENKEVELDVPRGIGIGRNGQLYVVDTGNNRFIMFDAEGRPALSRGSFGGGREQFREPTDLVVDVRGNVYIVDSGNQRVKKYDFSGNLVKIWGSEGSARGQFRQPSHVALDRWGYLYVTDWGNQRVQIFNQDGEPIMEFRSDTLVEPAGIAISRGDRVFVSDLAAHDIKVFQIIYRP